jgi:DNA-binding FadR family transcriptional regulator
MALPHLKRRSATLSAFDVLLEQILSGDLKPGEVLREKTLCEQLGLSRTVIREALARLAQLRVVMTKQGGDTKVLDFREHGGLDLLPWMLRRADGWIDPLVMRAGIEMRAALVPEIAAVCARRATSGVHERLTGVVEQMAGTDDLALRQQLSLRFWSIVVTACDNIAYQLAFNSVREAVEAMRAKVARGMEPELNDVAGYAAIAKAIARGDEPAARKAAQAHVDIGLKHLHYQTKKEEKKR